MSNEKAIAAVNEIASYLSSPCSQEKRKRRDELYSVIVAEHEYQISRITTPSFSEMPIENPTWKERLFLWYINGKPVQNPKIGVYWYLEMKVFDYQRLIGRLASGGFITATKVSESLCSLSLEQLRIIAKENELPCSGTKAKIVGIIERRIPSDQINENYSSFAKFMLTKRGKDVIEASAALILYHRNRNRIDSSISYENVESLVANYPSLTPMCAILLLEIERARNRDRLIKLIYSEYRRRE